MKVKTADLIGPTLDWAVAVVEGLTEEHAWTTIEIFKAIRAGGGYWYSTDWSAAGPLIERDCIGLEKHRLEGQRQWAACDWHPVVVQGHTCLERSKYVYGPTPLIAAMRCYCCAKLGEYVDIPEELCQRANS